MILKLQDAGKLRQLISSSSGKKEDCVIQDEQDRAVAVVLPIERYESYQAYLRQREKDFAIFDVIDEKMKDYDPAFIESQVEQAVAEVKTEAKESRT